MRDWFEGLEQREQVAVGIAAVFVAFAVLYFGLWRPLSISHDELADDVITWERALGELGPLKAAVQSSPGDAGPRTPAGQSLVVIVDSSVSRYGLSSALRRSQPSGPSGIRVDFENAAFDDLVRWLGNVGTGFGLEVQSANVSANTQGVTGRVNAQVTLQR